ncbi:hypothetical protein NN561_006811 [Cricetulus griseus]
MKGWTLKDKGKQRSREESVAGPDSHTYVTCAPPPPSFKFFTALWSAPALLLALATVELFSSFIFYWQQLAIFLGLTTSSWMPLSITLCCCFVLSTQPALLNVGRYSVVSASSFHSL